MSQELHYTSVSRGLNPGSRGFCTVACTPQMPGPLVERLEGLSGYQPVYPVHDPSASQNPINFSHLKLSIRGNSLSVLSRIGPAGLDYSGRSNKYAHHVVLETNELPLGGPAWLLSQPGFLDETWEGEPRVLTEGRTPPQGDRPGGVARAWQALTGDPGWAGVLAESFLADPRRPAFLIFRPGMDLLPLFVEAMALLPSPRRWHVEFSTYFTTLPQGVTCHWRGVLEGSPEANRVLRLPNTLVINLGHPAGRAEGRALVHQARTGEPPESPIEDSTASAPPSPSQGTASTFGRPPVPVNPSRGRPPSPPTHHERFPELGANGANRGSSLSDRQSQERGRRGQTLALVAGIAAACLTGIGGVGVFLFWPRNGIQKTPSLVAAAGEVKEVKTQDPETKAPEEPQRKEKMPILVQGGAEGQPAAQVKAEKPPNTAPTQAKAENPSTIAPIQAKAENPSTIAPTQAKAENPSTIAPIQAKAENPSTIAPTQAKAEKPSESKLPKKDIGLLFFDLPEPNSNLEFLKPSTMPGAPKLDLPRSGARQLELIDLSKSKATTAKRAISGLEARPIATGGLDVMIREADGKEHALAHFKLEGEKVHFEWDNDSWHSGHGEFRDQLRNRVLKITTNDGPLYALLRKGPVDSPEPLRIRANKDRRQNQFFPLDITKRKLFSVVDLKQIINEYSYLKNNVVIMNLESDLPALDGKKFFKEEDEKDKEGEVWCYEGNGNVKVIIKFGKSDNGIRFTFKVPNPLEEEMDCEAIEKLLDASYSLVLGLDLDGPIVRMVQIGSFTPKSKEVPR